MDRPIDIWGSTTRRGPIRAISPSVARSFGANGALTIASPGDDDPRSLHLGAFREGSLVAVASLIAPRPGVGDPIPPARLERFAELPRVRGTRIGDDLLRAVQDHARSMGWTGVVLPARLQDIA